MFRLTLIRAKTFHNRLFLYFFGDPIRFPYKPYKHRQYFNLPPVSILEKEKEKKEERTKNL